MYMYAYSTEVGNDESLIVSLHELYPGDVGCFCVFFLNTVQLFPGQAMFLPPNEPHCYIRGGKERGRKREKEGEGKGEGEGVEGEEVGKRWREREREREEEGERM